MITEVYEKMEVTKVLCLSQQIKINTQQSLSAECLQTKRKH